MDRSPSFQHTHPQSQSHTRTPTDEDDRRSRFNLGGPTENGAFPQSSSQHSSHHGHRERAASQPPRTSSSSSSAYESAFDTATAPAFASPPAQHYLPSSLGGGWGSSGNNNASNSSANSGSNSGGGRMLSPPGTRGQPMPMPIRSSSFSSHPQSQFASTMRDRVFPSTFEDDESEALSDTYEYDERYVVTSFPGGNDGGSGNSHANTGRGRSYGVDISRSRSQSLAAAGSGRPGPVGSPYAGPGGSAMQSWNDSYLSSSANPLNSTSSGRYGDIKPPSASNRFGTSLGRSPTNISSSPSSSLAIPNGPPYTSSRHHSHTQQQDISNMSPFVRDVGQILLDDGSAFRELWAGMNPPRDENGGGGSGTTSRRHSVSVVQPRRGVVGFNAPSAGGEFDFPEDGFGGGQGLGQGHGRGAYNPPFGSRGSGLLLSDDDLASDLGMLNIGPPSDSLSSHRQQGSGGLPPSQPSQPSSLPIYAPLSRSPPSRELIGERERYQSINLSIPSTQGGGGGGGIGRQPIGTPSEGEYSVGESPRLGSGAGGAGGLFEEQFSPQGNNQNQNQYAAKQQERYMQYSQAQAQAQQQAQQQAHYQQQHAQAQLQFPSHHPHPSTSPSQYVRNRATSYSSTSSLQSPLSPSASGGGAGGIGGPGRLVNPQQGPYFPQMAQRRLSDAHHHPHTPTSPHQAHQPFGAGPGPQSPNTSGGSTGPSLNDLGKGVPLHAVPSSWPLYIVEFKAGRTDLFYLPDSSLVGEVRRGDLVIVEADRGKDLGKVVNDSITLGEVEAWQRTQVQFGTGGGGPSQGDGDGTPVSPGGGQGGSKKEISPKMIYGKASQRDLQLLATKQEDEAKALALCQTKVRAKKLPMEVIDAEYQWDRRKLTFYFVAEKRIDFRELVRELFRLYKTRIWMASLQGGGGFEQ